jgi:hypothetical protein
VVWAAGEHVGDLIMAGEKPLHLPRRLEPLHDPLSSPGRPVGILRPIVEAFVLPMLDTGHDLALGGLFVALALDEDVENETFLGDSAPEPMLLGGDGDDDLVEVPFVAAARGSPAARLRIPGRTSDPLPDRLIGDRNAASRQHLLNHAQAQREPEIHPHRIADERGGVAIARIKRISGRHPR